MNEQENEQSQLAKPTVRSRIPSARWEQIKTARASGIGLREIARNMAKLAALPTEVIATATEYACDQIVSFLPCN